MFAIAGNGPSGYKLTRSLRFRASASAYLNRTGAASPTNYRKYTFSFWMKRGTLSTDQRIIDSTASGLTGVIALSAANELVFATISGGSGTNYLVTKNLLRDPSAWYHIVFSCDTSVASNQFKFYVNGVEASYSTNNAITVNYGTGINGGSEAFYIGRSPTYGLNFDGYFSEFNFIDGQALTPSSFGSTNSTTGVWQPAKYTGTYGTNGFYLPFTDNSALTTSSNVGLGKDFSGNGNYWTTNNISITSGVTYDSMTDVPTLTSATASNFAVLNPLYTASLNSGTISNGNLDIACLSGGGTSATHATVHTTTGKYYFEVTSTSNGGYGQAGLGIQSVVSGTFIKYTGAGGDTGYTSYGVYGIAYDVDAGKMWIRDTSGAWTSGDPIAGTSPLFTFTANSETYPIAASSRTSGSSNPGLSSHNFGQRPFTYTPPSGFVALNAYNLPDSTIKQGRKHMDSTLWIGDGSTSKSISNAAAFKPGFVWGKRRDAAGNHNLYDEIRGATNYLTSNGSGAEIAGVTGLTSFNSDGFSIGSHPDLNTSGGTFVGHQWKAGEGITTVNTAGSITSTVSVNASAGFSIVSLTGPASGSFTAGHGLGIAPSLIIAKIRNGTGGWPVYHAALGATGALQLESTGAFNVSTGYWNNTAPTSTVFTSNIAWGATQQIYYCWAEVPGFSKFGNFQGNGSADGPFVYTGFRPKFIMFKNYAAGGYSAGWTIIDTARSTYNVAVNCVQADTSAAEFTYVAPADILSNGFKIRTTWDSVNNPSPIAYIAFAENPFKNSLAR